MKLLAQYDVRQVTAPGRIVLMEDHEGKFVTWWETKSGKLVLAHRFEQEASAREDYRDRCKRGY